MDDKSILFRQREDGTWEEKPEPYAVIECETEEDFNHIKQRLEAMRWIPVEERLPEESLNSVIGWDEYRERCCFVQYYAGAWHLGDESARIIAWMPLPEPYRKDEEN